jgi:hypothetical protein
VLFTWIDFAISVARLLFFILLVPGSFIYFILLAHIFVPKPLTLLIVHYLGPPKGESNYEEAVEFDPIVYHNQYCPWVNGNVAAAGCASSATTGNDAIALCGWQLTLDALQSLGNAIPTVQSESAASLYKVCLSCSEFGFSIFQHAMNLFHCVQ